MITQAPSNCVCFSGGAGTLVESRSRPARSRRLTALIPALAGIVGAVFITCASVAQAQEPPGLISVTPDMLSGNFLFRYSGTITAFSDPIPYGFANNVTDSGWIWYKEDGVDGEPEMDVDMGAPTVVSQFRVWCSYAGGGGDSGARGAFWAIEYSDNNATWNQATVFNYTTGPGLGFNDDGTKRTDAAGWYGCVFNSEGAAHQYWRVRQTGIALTHCPRSATVQFFGPSALPFVVSTSPSGTAVRANAPIAVQVEDGLTAVKASTVQLVVNGTAVTPAITKPAGSKLTTISYTAAGGLPPSTNTVICVFGNTDTPPVLQTNEFSFVVINDEAGALVVNIDFKGIRNTATNSQEAFPTFAGQGSAGGGSVWNAVVADSRIVGGFGNNDSLTISVTDLVNSVGGATIIGFTASSVGGEAGGTFTTNVTDGAALMGDYLFINKYDNLVGLSPFTITGLGEVPSVDLYFYLGSGAVTIPGVTPTAFSSAGIYVWPNVIYPLYFRHVPVTGGQVSGFLGKGTALLGGITIQKPFARPFVKSTAPTGAGQISTPAIRVELEDYITQVAPNSIQLLVNGQTVQPSVAKSGGVTTVTYTPTAALPATNNIVQVIFGDNSTPPMVQTNDFSFVVAAADLLPVTASMLSGQATFMATDAKYTAIANPVPYGAANNTSDAGWIWNQDSYFTVDFGGRAAVTQFRAWCSYVGTATDDGVRGSAWNISYGDDINALSPATEFDFLTGPGLGVNEDGTIRADAGGWYGTNFNADVTAAGRYWQIYNMGTMIKHSPRAASVQFYGKILTPVVKSVAPTGGGNLRTATLQIVLQDGATKVAPATIQLLVNNKSVTPVVTKPAGSDLTTIAYDPKGALVTGQNDVTVSFGDTGSPSFVTTRSFSFVVEPDDYLPVTPDMVFASTTFLATPGTVNVGSPIPYGVANNTVDNGWIWINGSFLYVDFGAQTALKKFRIYSTYTVAPYSAVWAIEYSNDNVRYTKTDDVTCQSTVGGGVNDDGTTRDDCAGWYEFAFNSSTVTARYWRIRQTETADHAPRAAEMKFFGTRGASPLTLSYARQGASLVLSWTAAATLQSAEQIAGPWTEVSATSPQSVSTSAGQKFYRLRR